MHIYRQVPSIAGFTMALDKDGREFLSLVVKRTFEFPDEPQGSILPCAEQKDLVYADEYPGEPDLTACTWETDFAFRKGRCDVIVNGSAHAPGGQSCTKVQVGLRIGGITKTFHVFGERRWQQFGPSYVPTDPAPFVRQPISYQTAFGGTDRLDRNNSMPPVYEANPVGTGWASKANGDFVEGVLLPATQAVDESISSPFANYRPMAFGPYGRGWPERLKFAGTYDQHWIDEVFPFLPKDFDERYYQSAPQDQQIPHPRSGTQVALLNLTVRGREAFTLAHCELPITIFRKGQVALQREVLPDTVLMDTDARSLAMVWRVEVPVQKTLTEFTEAWVGPPTETMLRAKREGRQYIRAVSTGESGA